MLVIELDASNWHDVNEYYDALKGSLGSCEGHGSSPAAWVDSMIYGGMNNIEPPYLIRLTGTSRCPLALKQHIHLLADVIREAREWKKQNYGIDAEVSFDIKP